MAVASAAGMVVACCPSHVLLASELNGSSSSTGLRACESFGLRSEIWNESSPRYSSSSWRSLKCLRAVDGSSDHHRASAGRKSLLGKLDGDGGGGGGGFASSSGISSSSRNLSSGVGVSTGTVFGREGSRTADKKLNVSGPIAPYPNKLKNFWYPVAFSRDINADTLIPIESFEEPWVLFRGQEGRAGCVRDECAHRACPLSLGKVVDGKIQCPYHGWEYNTGGECKKMPSTTTLKASIRSLPCIEQDEMVWIWPGDETPTTVLPSLNPPANFTTHAELVLELPVEHGLLMENLLDLAHAPFTHTTTFAKGWPVPNFVRFKTPAAALSGYWDPYPIDMEFQPPCMVLSTIGLVKPGQLDGSSAQACSKHLHQLHVCMPSTRGKTRLLYRMALDFAQWVRYVPFITKLWEYLANQVMNEDLRLVEGQQDRMTRGANVWETPVSYDKLGVRYRRWRNAVEAGGSRIPFDSGPSEDS